MTGSVPWKAALAVVLAVEIGVLCLLGFTAKSPTADGLVIRAGDASIQAAEQTGPWGTLVIKQVVTPTPSWVVVQAQGGGGASTTVVGYTHVPAGVSNDVTVSLDPAQALVNSVAVSLVADRGQPGVFEFSPSAGASGGGMGGGGMGGGAAAQAGGSTDATISLDKPLLAQGKPVSIVLRETLRTGTPGIVRRSVAP